MLPLQHAALWRFLSAVLLLAVLAGTLSPVVWFDSKVEALVWFENADKWIHGLIFLFLSVWFAGLWERRAYWRVAIGLMLFGFIVEGCQLLVSYRTADWLDIAANTAGIIVGLTAATAGLGGWGLRLEARYSRNRRP
jgi:glycopeptide antibiotics resistance protein